MERSIIKNNKLIAEFMGAKMIVSDYHGINLIQFPDKSTKDLHGLNYHSLWDRLMPIVERIRGNEFVENFNINITCDCIIEGINGLDIHVYCDRSIDTITATWLAVVEFVKWYNKQVK